MFCIVSFMHNNSYLLLA